MSMQPRERLLAALLAAVVGFYVLRPVLTGLFVQPLRERDGRIRTLTMEVGALHDQEFALKRADRMLATYRAQSLPPDPLNAQREYLEWLTDVAAACRWREPQLSLGPATPRGPALTTVSITIKAKARLDDVNRFLRYLESVAVLHRVSDLYLESADPQGNSLLDVTLTAEGVAVTGAPPRTRLFSTTTLKEALGPADSTAVVRESDGFPDSPPFLVRLNSEFVEVERIEGDRWTVRRGVAGSAPADHGPDAPVEFTPLRDRELLLGNSRAMPVAHRLFVKALGGEPRVVADLEPAVHGRPWTATLTVQNWDPEAGRPEFRLVDPPAGLSVDADSGTLSWTPGTDVRPGTHEVSVIVLGRDVSKPVIQEKLALELRRANRPPRLTAPASVDVWLGRPWELALRAEDPDLPDDRLTYAVAGSVPDGLTIDPRTGVLRWTPPLTMDLGEIRLQVTVTDSGSPPESSRGDLTLRLADDSAHYTYFVGSVGQGGTREAWLYDRSINRRTVVREGESFRIADVEGTVTRIAADAMDVRSGDAIYRLEIGQNFRSWRKIGEASRAATAEPKTGSDAKPET